MLHEPAAQTGIDRAADYKRGLGMKMFIFYALFYAGFVAVNVISPVLMEKEIIFGMNLACTYGFVLILVALIMALIYNHMCTKRETLLNTDDPQEEGN